MALSHAIMTALFDQNLTGYDLARQFDVSLGFFWNASHQQIYQQLRKLAEQGYVSVTEVAQSGKPDKRIYGLTPAGQSALSNWVACEARRKPARDDLLVQLYNLDLAGREQMQHRVRQRQGEHQQRLALYGRIRDRGYSAPEALDERGRGRYLALLAGIFQEQAALRWCDEALEMLSR